MSLKVKTDFKGDIRVLRQSVNSASEALIALKQHCEECYGFKDVNQFDLRYHDEENDCVTISGPQDLEDAMECAKNKGLKTLKILVAAKENERKRKNDDEEEKMEDNEENSDSSNEENARNFWEEIKENIDFRNEFVAMIEDFLNCVRSNEKRDLNVALVMSLEKHEIITKHRDFNHILPFVTMALEQIQPYAVFIAAIDPSYIREISEFIFKKMEECCQKGGNAGPAQFGGCAMLFPLLHHLRTMAAHGGFGGHPAFGGFPFFGPGFGHMPHHGPRGGRPHCHRGGPHCRPRHGGRHGFGGGHRHGHGHGHRFGGGFHGLGPFEIKAVNAPNCICGDKLNILAAKDCYIKETKMVNRISCDACGLKCDSEIKIWHCPRGKASEHPKGYDICFKCNDGGQSKQDVICMCGATMVERTVDTAYPSVMQQPSQQQIMDVECDICGVTIQGDAPVYHCSNQNKVSMHPSGYDVCLDCAEKMDGNAKFEGLQTPATSAILHCPGMGHRWLRGAKTDGTKGCPMKQKKEKKERKTAKQDISKGVIKTKKGEKCEKKDNMNNAQMQKKCEKLQAKQEKLKNKLQKLNEKLAFVESKKDGGKIESENSSSNDENNIPEFVIENNDNCAPFYVPIIRAQTSPQTSETSLVVIDNESVNVNELNFENVNDNVKADKPESVNDVANIENIEPVITEQPKQEKPAYKFEEQLQQLINMGFEEEQSKVALNKFKGNISQAANHLLA